MLLETPGGGVSLRGDAKGRAGAKRAVEALAARIETGAEVEESDVRAAIVAPAVSQHLRVLTHAGLVMHDRDGTRRVYRTDPRGIEAMRKYLDKFWDRALAAFKAAAEKEMDS